MNLKETHCCGLLLLQNVNTNSEQLETLLAKAKSDQYGLVIATTNEEDRKAYGLGRFLAKHGFKIIKRFKNPNSGNQVFVHSYNLRNAKTPAHIRDNYFGF